MAKPIPLGETVKLYLLLQMIAGKISIIHNGDLNSTGLFPTLELAQQQQLIEILKNPACNTSVYEIEWPTHK